MEQIFIGILNSDYEESFKRALIEKIIIPAANNENTAEASVAVLQTSFSISVAATKPLDRQMGERVYLAWAQCHINELAMFFQPLLIQNYMSEGISINKSAFFNLLNETAKILYNSHRELLSEIFLTIQNNSIEFLSSDDSLETAKALACLFLNHKDAMPLNNSLKDLGQKILKIISKIEVPNILTKHSPIVQDTQLISYLYREMNCQLDNGFYLYLLYMVFYCLTESEDEPSLAIGGLIQCLRLSPTSDMISRLLSNEMNKFTAFNILLQRLINMLQWPTNSVIAEWIISLMKHIALGGKFSLLIEVSQLKIVKILDLLTYAEDYKGTLVVFQFILLSYQHSPDVFHKIVEFIPSTLSELEKRLSENDKDILIQIVEVIHTMMYHHAGFPQLYDPILLALKPFPKPSNERMNQLLNENRWLRANCRYTVYHPSCSSRSATGNTGLVNLGNTCYMNCIIQALYSTHVFRTAVLRSHPSPEQKILLNLQKLFAYLTHTQRVAIEPSEFLKLSCPPWFISNHQQDCSEYLRYLLDCLHEQEVKEKKIKKHDESNNSQISIDNVIQAKKNDCYKSLVRSVFSGQLISTYHCLSCHQISERAEIFIDLHLAFPNNQKSQLLDNSHPVRRQTVNKTVFSITDLQPQPEPACSQNSKKDQNLNLQTLLSNYFDSEKLEGENRYYCENCKSLTDALRSIRIVEPPNHLILTLLRFSYDPVIQKHSKIQTNVHYPLQLKLPVSIKSSQKDMSVLNNGESSMIESDTYYEQLYYLYAIIIHSGVSSDSGHYYTYASPHAAVMNADGAFVGESEGDDSNNQWYLFNDSSVSYCPSSSFRTVTQRFPKDTAYVLLYRKAPIKIDDATFEDAKTIVLRKELRDEIDRDNLRYLQEEEERLQRFNRCGTRSKHKKFDDNHPPGSCGGGGGGFTGFQPGNFPFYIS